MSDKEEEPREPKKRRLKKKRSRARKTVEHELAARWIQDQVLEDIPELGYISDKLIEKILRLEHQYYVSKGYKQIKFDDESSK